MEMNLHFALLAYHVSETNTSLFLYSFTNRCGRARRSSTEMFLRILPVPPARNKKWPRTNETLVGNDTDMPRRRYDSSREVPLAAAREREKR